MIMLIKCDLVKLKNCENNRIIGQIDLSLLDLGVDTKYGWIVAVENLW